VSALQAVVDSMIAGFQRVSGGSELYLSREANAVLPSIFYSLQKKLIKILKINNVVNSILILKYDAIC
jgi:hypothetical protein